MVSVLLCICINVSANTDCVTYGAQSLMCRVIKLFSRRSGMRLVIDITANSTLLTVLV